MNSFSREVLEAEMALRFLARANPPPILFRYRRPSDWTIDEISKQQLYAATSQELNDPFECCAPVFWNIELMKEQFIKYAPAFGLSPDVVAASQSDPTEIAANITCQKSSEWEFEEEYRVASDLGDIRLIPFNASAIKEIRLGARIKAEFREKVMEAVSHLPHRPTLIQMGCDFARFILTESVV